MNIMNSKEIKKIMIRSLDIDADPAEASRVMEEEVVSYTFSKEFADKVLGKIYSPVLAITREVEFMKYLNLAFYRIALTGVAAIIILMISIFFMEGSLSLNSLIGLNDGYDESIVCLLTGN